MQLGSTLKNIHDPFRKEIPAFPVYYWNFKLYHQVYTFSIDLTGEIRFFSDRSITSTSSKVIHELSYQLRIEGSLRIL